MHSRDGRTQKDTESEILMRFTVEIRVIPRKGILDPQGKAVAGALTSLGFDAVDEVHVGRFILLELEAESSGSAGKQAEAMCAQLLANPVTEDFDIRVNEVAVSAR